MLLLAAVAHAQWIKESCKRITDTQADTAIVSVHIYALLLIQKLTQCAFGVKGSDRLNSIRNLHIATHCNYEIIWAIKASFVDLLTLRRISRPEKAG